MCCENVKKKKIQPFLSHQKERRGRERRGEREKEGGRGREGEKERDYSGKSEVSHFLTSFWIRKIN